MKSVITIDPFTRISGFLEIQVEIDNNIVTDAKSSGLLFRGFEKLLVGRYPLDAVYITERICGICSTSHAYASTTALEDAINLAPTEMEVLVRDIIHGAEFLQNHIRHFYLFVVPDYVRIPEISDFVNSDAGDFRLPENISNRIADNYRLSLNYSRMAHEALAILGGKAPHNHGIFVGGINDDINAVKLIKLKALIDGIERFINDYMFEDVNTISDYYKDYFHNGTGYGNLMSYGLYNSTRDNSESYVFPKVYINNIFYDMNYLQISENIYSSWYNSVQVKSIPGQKFMEEDIYKKDAYSWIKAPRYMGYAMEVGPLARMYLSGKYKNGISTMDRITARMLEAKLIASIMQNKIIRLEEVMKSNLPEIQHMNDMPVNAQGKALIDTVRGSLAHFINIQDKKIAGYDIITPSGWNLSPMDSKGVKGVVEKALIGTEIKDMEHPVEIGRIVRSFDPCVSCAVHVASNRYKPMEISIL